MDLGKLRKLLSQEEGLKLDFKQEFYKIDHSEPKVGTWQWNEFAKDLIALCNGNVGTSNQEAYLIIGVGDRLKSDGTRDLYDVGSIKITKQMILERVNAICSPPLPDILVEIVLYEGERLLVISILPSPHLHQLKKKIEVSDRKTFDENSILIRRGEGIYTASLDEAQAIIQEKRELKRNDTLDRNSIPRIDQKEANTKALPGWMSFWGIALAVSVFFGCVGITMPSLSDNNNKIFHFFVISVFGLPFGLITAGGFQIFLRITANRKILRTVSGTIFLTLLLLGITLGIVALSQDGPFTVENIVAGTFTGSVVGAVTGVLLISILLLVNWIIGKVVKRN